MSDDKPAENKPAESKPTEVEKPVEPKVDNLDKKAGSAEEAKPVADPYFDEKEFPGVNTSEWKRYYDTLDANRMRHIAKLAVNDKFSVRMVKDATKPKNKWEYENKEFKYYEVTVKEWQALETLRAEHGDLTQYAAKKLTSTEDNPKQEEWNFRRQLAEKFVELYRYGSKAFLCMEDAEFDKGNWTDIRDAVDACNHRTIYSLPNSQGTFMSSSTSGVQ